MCLPVYLCLFVSIRGSSSLTIGCFSSNDPHGRALARIVWNTPCFTRYMPPVVWGGGPAKHMLGVSP